MDFDALFRSHLANVYQALNHRPPDALSQTIKRLRQQVVSTSPIVAISPCIDGAITNYFEWMGAGFYSPVQMASTTLSAQKKGATFWRLAKSFDGFRSATISGPVPTKTATKPSSQFLASLSVWPKRQNGKTANGK